MAQHRPVNPIDHTMDHTPTAADREWTPTGISYLIRHRSGTYYARFRCRGALIRRTLGTKVLEEAKTALAKVLLDERSRPAEAPERPVAKPASTWADAEALYLQRSSQDVRLAPRTVEYRQYCTRVIRDTFPGIAGRRVGITPDEVRGWAARTGREYSATLYNNVIAVARDVYATLLELAGRAGEGNPFVVAERLGIKPTELSLPSTEELNSLLTYVAEHPSGAEASRYLRLIVYFGLRQSEAQDVVWGDFDFARGVLTVRSAKDRRASGHAPTRRVPIVPEARAFFFPLAAGRAPQEAVVTIASIRFWFEAASRVLGIPLWSHHDMRHLFATRCIESGVDIPTVSRWLGHKDGGALAMRTYGHLRDEHSQASAAKVTFS